MRLRLYIAGDAPSARAAQRSLQALLKALPALGASCEIIDVLTRPGEAARVGLLATPTLVVEGGGRRRSFVGDFSAAPRLHETLSDFAARGGS